MSAGAGAGSGSSALIPLEDCLIRHSQLTVIVQGNLLLEHYFKSPIRLPENGICGVIAAAYLAALLEHTNDLQFFATLINALGDLSFGQLKNPEVLKNYFKKNLGEDLDLKTPHDYLFSFLAALNKNTGQDFFNFLNPKNLIGAVTFPIYCGGTSALENRSLFSRALRKIIKELPVETYVLLDGGNHSQALAIRINPETGFKTYEAFNSNPQRLSTENPACANISTGDLNTIANFFAAGFMIPGLLSYDFTRPGGYPVEFKFWRRAAQKTGSDLFKPQDFLQERLKYFLKPSRKDLIKFSPGVYWGGGKYLQTNPLLNDILKKSLQEEDPAFLLLLENYSNPESLEYFEKFWLFFKAADPKKPFIQATLEGMVKQTLETHKMASFLSTLCQTELTPVLKTIFLPFLDIPEFFKAIQKFSQDYPEKLPLSFMRSLYFLEPEHAALDDLAFQIRLFSPEFFSRSKTSFKDFALHKMRTEWREWDLSTQQSFIALLKTHPEEVQLELLKSFCLSSEIYLSDSEKLKFLSEFLKDLPREPAQKLSQSALIFCDTLAPDVPKTFSIQSFLRKHAATPVIPPMISPASSDIMLGP